MLYTAKTLSTIFGTGDGGNQPTTALVDRSFSMVYKLLAKDQDFLSKNNKLHVSAL